MTSHSFPTGTNDATCVHCGVRFDSFQGVACKGTVERELADARAEIHELDTMLGAARVERDQAQHRELAMRIATRKLIRSLGEFVRQSMHSNPEWAEGIQAAEEAADASEKVIPTPRAKTAFET